MCLLASLFKTNLIPNDLQITDCVVYGLCGLRIADYGWHAPTLDPLCAMQKPKERINRITDCDRPPGFLHDIICPPSQGRSDNKLAEAARTENNFSRDFWRFCKLPIAARPHHHFFLIMARHIFPLSFSLASKLEHIAHMSFALKLCQVPIDLEIPVVSTEDEHRITSAKLPFVDLPDLLAYIHDELKLRTPWDHINMYWDWATRRQSCWARLGGDGVIPIGIYADETKFGPDNSASSKVLGVFVNLVLFRPQSIRYSRFCVFTILSSRIAGHDTLRPVFSRLTWGLHMVFRGLNSSGGPLCKDGSRFLMTELRGDLSWHRMAWGFLKHWGAIDCCFLCCARQRGRCLMTEVGEHPAWVATIYDDPWHWASEVLPASQLCILTEAEFVLNP